MPGQAVDSGQLVPGRTGAVPRELSGALQPSDSIRVLGFRKQLWPSLSSLLCPLLAPALGFQIHQDLLGSGTPASEGREAVG